MQGEEVVRFKLSAVRDRLMEAGVRWSVFAGATAYCYGSKREVTDIDVLVNGVDLEKAKEDNIIFKAILQRTEKQGKHDIEDIRCMVKCENIDVEYLKKRVQKYRAEKRVNPLLKLLKIL